MTDEEELEEMPEEIIRKWMPPRPAKRPKLKRRRQWKWWLFKRRKNKEGDE